MNKRTILIVEDEKYMIKELTSVLRGNGYRVISTDIGLQALSVITSYCPDMVLLDLGQLDFVSYKIIKSIRSWSNMPILIFSERTKKADVVQALDLGADDYVRKPVWMEELLARIRVAFRKYNSMESYQFCSNIDNFRVREFEIDYRKRLILVGGKYIHLTQNEYKIVSLLAQNAGNVLTYENIIQAVWGPYADKNNKILRVNMSNIRRKIEKNPSNPKIIMTISGTGYWMVDK